MDIQNKVTLVFTAFGIVAGVVSGWLSVFRFQPPLEALEVFPLFLFALMLFYISYRLVPQVFNLVEEPLPDDGSKKIIMLGLLPFWLMWLIFLIMIHTLGV
jgi:zinc transporter ZupT